MPLASRMRDTATGFALACHPGPCFVVTCVVTAASFAAGRRMPGLVLVAVTVLIGQLSVGWSNDARDADRDLRAGRVEKPTVRGLVTARQLRVAAALAVLLAVPLSFLAAGVLGGLAHIVALASAWSYNLWLKTTRLSPLPYALSFGLIPAFVTYGLTPPAAPAVWVTVACAAMGAGAHLANALPDLDSDREISAGGLVAALGARVSTALALAAMVVAVVVLVAHLPIAGWAAALIVGGVLLASVVVALVGQGRTLFRFIMGLAILAVLLLIAAAGSITA
jgi:4-hydroxybenzoate polyprenyltransferase